MDNCVMVFIRPKDVAQLGELRDVLTHVCYDGTLAWQTTYNTGIDVDCSIDGVFEDDYEEEE